MWDVPWEYNGEEVFDAIQYRKECLEWLIKEKDRNRMCWGFQICVNDESRKHIGWCNAYDIDDNYEYTKEDGYCTIGVDIPDISLRRKGYATASWDIFIEYLLSNGIEDIYTQTWSGNEKVIGLIKKLGFDECTRKHKIRAVRGQPYDGLTFKLDRKKYNDFHEQMNLKELT